MSHKHDNHDKKDKHDKQEKKLLSYEEDKTLYKNIISKKQPSCALESMLFEGVFEKTPDYIKLLNLIDLTNKNEFIFTLKKEYLFPYDKQTNPEGLNLLDWFENYEKEAKVSTAGIRGPQNILFPQDTRFPINLIGITLATLAKVLVIKEKGYKNPVKLAAREVRYNSDLYLEAIARIQAAYGIKTILPTGKKTIPIWLASFLIFKLGFLGGEYITASHSICVKNATKDLNSQGSQYLPEESLEFVKKIKEVFQHTIKKGFYEIKFSAEDNPLIDEKTMAEINDGIDLYVEYLKTSVARPININYIKKMNNKIVIENVGGSAYRTLSRVMDKLKISEKFEWLNIKEDPFFHSIGKYSEDPDGKEKFYDYSVDATTSEYNEYHEKVFPVINSMQYDKKLANYPVNTVILITDPDHDRITLTQIESARSIERLNAAGIEYIKLSQDRVLTVYSANQAFLMIMNCRSEKLKEIGEWDKSPRFIIKTTASSISWDEWANKNKVEVINVPVGFKEIANIIRKIENKLRKHPDKDVIIHDIFNKKINLGKNPRLHFAGEESGGLILGPPKFIDSKTGYSAIAMREKSATEAIIGLSALYGKLEKRKQTLSQYFVDVINKDKISSKFDTRVDITYYNESEPDIEKLRKKKEKGEKKRIMNDLFYLSLAMALEAKIITIEQAREILSDTFKELDFSDLNEIRFVGDGTYLKSDKKFVEIRPSGTDAKTKAYAAGTEKKEIEKFAQILGNFDGERTSLHRLLIPENLYNSAKEKSLNHYTKYTKMDT